MNVLTVFAKDPEVGRGKSRLARSVGERHAGNVARALLSDALQLADAVRAEGVTVSVFHTPDRPDVRDRMRSRAPKLGHEAQAAGGLGERMAACFDGWFRRGAERVVVVGTDCPTLSPEDVHAAFTKLETSDVVLGPASDGGYVLIGLSAPRPSLFEGIDWSTGDVLAQTVGVARREDLSLSLLPVQCDLDTVEDVRPVFGLLEAGLLTMKARGQATYWTLQDLLSRPPFNPPPYEVRHFDEAEAVECPCGTARRVWGDAVDFPATVHRTEITLDAKPHRHARQTECYVVLECGPDAALELDGQRVPVRPGSTALIRPGCVHRAVGEMTVLIVCSPKFDAGDEEVVSTAGGSASA